MANFNLDDYVTVNERVEKFYADYPSGTIETEITSNIDSKVIIKASVYRCQDDRRPCTGHAMEVEGTTYINKTSHIENCETSAVGRALAFMGYEIKKSIASREEVETAVTRQNEMEVAATTKKAPAAATKTSTNSSTNATKDIKLDAAAMDALIAKPQHNELPAELGSETSPKPVDKYAADFGWSGFLQTLRNKGFKTEDGKVDWETLSPILTVMHINGLISSQTPLNKKKEVAWSKEEMAAILFELPKYEKK